MTLALIELAKIALKVFVLLCFAGASGSFICDILNEFIHRDIHKESVEGACVSLALLVLWIIVAFV